MDVEYGITRPSPPQSRTHRLELIIVLKGNCSQVVWSAHDSISYSLWPRKAIQKLDSIVADSKKQEPGS